MTYILIFLTVAVSIVCFGNRNLATRLSMNPYAVWHRREWWRLLTHGFVHADYTHLLVNMFVLWSFGALMERIFKIQEFAGVISDAYLTYFLLYFGGMVAASLYDLFKRRDDPRYRAPSSACSTCSTNGGRPAAKATGSTITPIFSEPCTGSSSRC